MFNINPTAAAEIFAILYRSKTQAPPLEEQLRLSDVPYTIIGGEKFFDKKEIKDLIAYLCTIHNTSDEIALRRIINIPHRGIGSATLKKFIALRERKRNHLISSDERLSRNSGAPREAKIRRFIQFIEEIKQFFTENSLPHLLVN